MMYNNDHFDHCLLLLGFVCDDVYVQYVDQSGYLARTRNTSL